MRRVLLVTFASLLLPSPSLAQTGDVTRIHAPSIARRGDTLYLYCTGHNLAVRTSADLFTWRSAAPALAMLPPWTHEYDPPDNAPRVSEVSFCNGRWHPSYPVSTFGKRNSAAGVATNVTLAPTRRDDRRVDHGRVIGTTRRDAWNAIGPPVPGGRR